nr:unnamed protein product [Callosobruchus chinensis]
MNEISSEESVGKTTKKPMTEEERIALATKLDKELDEFIENLPRKKYEDGWPEDRWEEEMAKHPFFMKEPPKPGDDLHPLFEGLQKLKYDPDENDPEELSLNYKEDGNYNFKYKNYRLAVIAYTEGLKVKCGNSDIDATLLNNRAAAHYFLKNYRSALKDCELALKMKPDYDKAMKRAANCCYEMRQYNNAIQYCEMILDKEKDDRTILELRKKCVGLAKVSELNARKKQFITKKKEKEEDNLVKTILERGYKLEGGDLSLEKLEPCFPQLVHHRVHVDENNHLVWPVVFVYPEYKVMDYIQQFHENTTFLDQMLEVFEAYPEWDERQQYKAENLNVYFETPKKKLGKVDVNATLSETLRSPGYIIRGGTPSFMILVRDSPVEKKFLVEYGS